MKLGESNLLDHRGIKAVETAVKPHTLKEKKGESEIRPHSLGGLQIPADRRVWGAEAGWRGQWGPDCGSGRRVCTLDMMSSSSLRAL